MKVEIYSRAAVSELIAGGFPEKTAVISFYTPRGTRRAEDLRVDYSAVCDRVFYIAVPDIDLKCLGDYGYTYESYIEDTAGLSRFVYDALRDGWDLICQCDFGQSRSAACAAAVLEHLEGRGIDIFADYRYYPNQLVYHKVHDALEEHLERLVTDAIKASPDGASADAIQRKCGLGFGRARSAIDKLLLAGAITAQNGKYLLKSDEM